MMGVVGEGSRRGWRRGCEVAARGIGGRWWSVGPCKGWKRGGKRVEKGRIDNGQRTRQENTLRLLEGAQCNHHKHYHSPSSPTPSSSSSSASGTGVDVVVAYDEECEGGGKDGDGVGVLL